MKELFDTCEKVGLDDKKNLVFLDTCFIFSLLDRGKELTPGHPYALTSFNVEEILHVGHKLHKMKTRLRRFLKSHDFIIVEVPVHPGDRQGELDFVNSIDSELMIHLPDPSDAVLLAAAIKTHSIVLTKDKRDLFQVDLVNYLRKYNIKVLKEMKDLE